MNYVYVGKFVGTHGLKGELKLKSSFLYKDKILVSGFCFYIGESKDKVKLVKYRFHNGIYLMTFDNLLDINLVEKYKSADVYVLRDDLSLNDNEFVFEDYIGLKCYFNDLYLGIVNDIIDGGNGNYIIQIIGDKEVLIPLNDNFIDKVMLNDKIVFKEVEGLINAN